MLPRDSSPYYTLFNSIDQGCCIIRVIFDETGKSCDYQFEEVNEAFERQSGLHGAAGRRMREFAPGLEEYWFELYGRIAKTGKPERLVAQASELQRWYDVHAFRFGNAEDCLVAVLFEDITARKQTDDALRDSEERFRNMANNTPFMIWVTEPDASCTFLSRTWYEFTGQTPATGLGFGWLEAVHPDDRGMARDVFMAATAKCEPFRLEYRLLRNDGEYRWAIDAAAPRLGSDGRFLGFIGSVIDITDRQRAEEKLRDADRRKDEFLATLAHELRNPLAPLRAGLAVLRSATDSPEQAGRVHAMLERQVNHMVRLVEDLLEISRISGGKVELRKERVNLSTVVLSAVEISQPLIDAARHRLVIDLAPEPLVLEADAVRLAQVVANLLNNAAKYTNDGGNIWLGTRHESGQAVVSVMDNGLGISAAMLPKVFELFAQVQTQSYGRSQGGLGIGLTLVRSLVELHGGSVEARSAGIGKGSEFVVRLPLAADQSSHTGYPPLEKLVTRTSGHRILVVDDNVDAADSLGMLLGLLGVDVSVAHNGAEALQLAQGSAFDAALLDIGMPDMDGHQLARELRAQVCSADMMLVAVTGWGKDEDRRLSADAGFDHHVVKPLDVDALQGILALVEERSMPVG